MSKKTVIHLRDQYLRVTFISYMLCGFKKFQHYILCREIYKNDKNLYPFENIIKTHGVFSVFWMIDKILVSGIKLHSRVINDWISYYFSIKKLSNVVVIHAHMGQQGYYAIPLSRKLNIPLVVTFYGADMSSVPKIPGWKEKYLELFEYASLIIVEGPQMRERLIKIGAGREKVKVCRIGIPLDKIKFSIRPKYTSDTKLKILMCATFVEKKGFMEAFEALSILRSKNFNFHCSIIGDGPQYDNYLERISELNLEGFVSFLGRKNTKEIYLISQDFHIFLHPSKVAKDGDTEGGAPTVIIEMQALGLPVVATKHADIPFIIPVNNQYLAKEGCSDDIALQIVKLSNDCNSWDNISLQGKEFSEINHSNLVTSSCMEEFYRRLVTK